MVTREITEYDIATSDDLHLERSQRLRNLMWTVSGNYNLNIEIDEKSWQYSRYISMYDAVKQGGFDRFFDVDALARYMVRKIYLGANAVHLQNIAQLCVDEAVYPALLRERPGVEEIRRKAFESLLDRRFAALNDTYVGKVKIALMRGFLSGDWDAPARIREPLRKIRLLEDIPGSEEKGLFGRLEIGGENAEERHPEIPSGTMKIIRVTDNLYNTMIDPHYEADRGSLERVLSVRQDSLKKSEWKDLAEEDADESLEDYIEQLSRHLTDFDSGSKEDDQDRPKKKKSVIVLSEEDLAKMSKFIELNYGPSYLSEQETNAINYRLCRGAHTDCRLYYTDGILAHPQLHNAQYVSGLRQRRNNERFLSTNTHVAASNIDTMTAYLKRFLDSRTQIDRIDSYAGQVVPQRLWKVGRLDDPGKLFYKKTKEQSNDFVIGILMDESGSQRRRQSEVVLQAYIIARAFSNLKIPHKVTGFNTFWDYTVMHRLRDYDDPPESDQNAVNFIANSNNRDGLAVRAAGYSLMKRPEEKKILIVLSDGRPNDVTVNRPNSRNPEPYFGEYALKDTAFEIRQLRAEGISVLGVFTGEEKDLQAEKKIFGRDFCYIRDIRNFSHVVSLYMARLLSQDAGEY